MLLFRLEIHKKNKNRKKEIVEVTKNKKNVNSKKFVILKK